MGPCPRSIVEVRSGPCVCEAAAAFCLSWWGGGTTVLADPYGWPNPGYTPDGYDHGDCYSSVPSADQFYMAEAMEYLDSRTNLYNYHSSTCGDSTDVVWVPSDLPGSRGAAVCARWASYEYRVCDQFWLQYDTAQIYSETLTYNTDGDNGGNFYANFRKTLRHELGHSVGLSHSNDRGDAMETGWVPTQLRYVTYDDHHRDHINTAWP